MPVNKKPTQTKEVENFLEDVLRLRIHAQKTTENQYEDKLRLLVATLNVIRLELLDKEPEFAKLIERSFLICGINTDGE